MPRGIAESKEKSMRELFLYLVNRLRQEEGQDLAEYAILLALIALVVLVAVTVLGTNLSFVFWSMAGRLFFLGFGSS
jgi:pilus assembly protein Flp/PilA